MNNIKAIYKIENMINHHIYIGQSNNPERRWKEHCTNNNNYISLINSAIQKYGKENFSFEIIGWFEDYNEKEKFYINFYNTIRPNGYNICPGGEEPPVLKGESHPNCKITSNIAKQIKEDLKDWNIPRKNIIKKYNITNNIIRHINNGDSWFDENEIYPIRPDEKIINNLKVDNIIKTILTTDIPLNQIGPMFGWSRSSAKMINQGKNHFNENLIYPLRNNKEINKTLLNL